MASKKEALEQELEQARSKMLELLGRHVSAEHLDAVQIAAFTYGKAYAELAFEVAIPKRRSGPVRSLV